MTSDICSWGAFACKGNKLLVPLVCSLCMDASIADMVKDGDTLDLDFHSMLDRCDGWSSVGLLGWYKW